MELRQLKYFLAVADARSFVSAANNLYISRQAVSKAISQLETELSVELFVRDSSGAFLTPAGLMFYDRIRSSVMELEQVRSEMQRYGARYHQRVRLAFSLGILQHYEPALQEFRLEQGNLALEYRECPDSDCLELLREHEADLAICAGEVKQGQEFAVQILDRSPYGILLQENESLDAMESLELKDLNWIPLAGLQDGAMENLRRKYGLHLQYVGYDLYRLFSLTLSGQCAMVIPKSMQPRSIRGLQWMPLEGVEPWVLSGVCLQSLENNVLYHTTIDELQTKVFGAQAVSQQIQKEEKPFAYL